MTPDETIHESLQKLNYGIYVVTSLKSGSEMTTRNHDWVSASAISWLTQVSFEPKLVAFSVEKTSNLAETIEKSRNFAVHILSEDDRSIVKDFDGPADFTDEQVNGHSFTKGKTGAPILGEGLAVVEFELTEVLKVHGSGSHVLLVGKPVSAELRDPKAKSIAIEETRFEYGG